MTAQNFSQALGDAGFRHGEEAAAGVTSASGVWKGMSIALGALALVFAALLLRPEPPERQDMGMGELGGRLDFR